MKLSESEIKDVLGIQKRLESKIDAHKKEIMILEKNWEILDRVVAESSFTKASDLMQESNNTDESSNYDPPPPSSSSSSNSSNSSNNSGSSSSVSHTPSATRDAPPSATRSDAPPSTNETQTNEPQTNDPPITPILDTNTDQIIANAYRAPDYISIMMSDDASFNLTVDVEPFESFFVKKILEQMKRKDQEEVQNGTIPPQSAMDYDVEVDPDTNRIINIIIRNYRDERRATELISTAGWSFTRMLEKINNSG